MSGSPEPFMRPLMACLSYLCPVSAPFPEWENQPGWEILMWEEKELGTELAYSSQKQYYSGGGKLTPETLPLKKFSLLNL